MSDRVRVWCLLHAASEANAKAPGAGKDRGLTELGRRQAIDAAHKFAAEPIARIYASTALRARQTAELLATTLAPTPSTLGTLGTLGLPTPPVTAMPELVEVSCSAEVLRAWVVEQDLGQRASDGETGQQVVARVTAAFQQIAGAHPGETVAVVGHVASLTVALGRL